MPTKTVANSTSKSKPTPVTHDSVRQQSVKRAKSLKRVLDVAGATERSALDRAIAAGKVVHDTKQWIVANPTLKMTYKEWFGSNLKGYQQTTADRYERAYLQVNHDKKVSYPSIEACLRAFQERLGKKSRETFETADQKKAREERQAAKARKAAIEARTPEETAAIEARAKAIEETISAQVDALIEQEKPKPQRQLPQNVEQVTKPSPSLVAKVRSLLANDTEVADYFSTMLLIWRDSVKQGHPMWQRLEDLSVLLFGEE